MDLPDHFTSVVPLILLLDFLVKMKHLLDKKEDREQEDSDDGERQRVGKTVSVGTTACILLLHLTTSFDAQRVLNIAAF